MSTKSYLPHTWADSRLFVKESHINGQGVFCGQDIHAGEVLMIWGGIPVPKDNFDTTAYRFQTVVPISEELFLALPVTDQEDSVDEYLNHSCDPNTWLIDDVTVIARRDIPAGQELTLECATWDDGTLKEYAPAGICTCGAKSCRGILSSDDWKRPELQKEFAGHFSPFIAERIRRLHD